MTITQSGTTSSWIRPLASAVTNSTPIRVPTIDPLPPVRLAPPRNTAVATANSRPVPELGAMLPSSDARTTPASPVYRPATMYMPRRNRSTFMAACRAASGLPPTAKRWRPTLVVRSSTIDTTAVKTRKYTGTGMSKSRSRANRKPSSRTWVWRPSVMTKPAPWRTNSMARVATSGLMRSLVMMRPLARPVTPPTRKPTVKASTSGTPATNSFPETTPTIIIPDPIERSSPPPISTRVKPAATMNVTELNWTMVSRLVVVKK